nr:hypothetical protein [Tanacetum cinerariifolium]
MKRVFIPHMAGEDLGLHGLSMGLGLTSLGNPRHPLKDKGVIDSGFSRHMNGNISYLSKFKEINGGYVAFGGNPKGRKITGKGSGPTWLFNIDTLTQSMNYQPVVVGNQPNSSADVAAFEVKEPESAVHVSPSSYDKTKKLDDKTKKEAKEKITAVGSNSTDSTNTFSAACPSNNAVSLNFELDDEEDVGVEADFSNLETNITASPIQTTRVYKDHPFTQIIGDLSLAPRTRSMARMVKDQGGLTQINDEDFHTCMFACFLSQEEPKRVHQALKDPSWIEAMQEELLQFKMQKVWVLVDIPKGKRAIGSKCIFRNKKDERGFEDLDYPDKVYKVVKALYGLHQAPRAWYETLANYLLENGFQRGKIDQTLFIKRKKGNNFADLLTKALDVGRFQYLVASIGLLNP